MKTIRRFLQDERGTETAEWALVLGAIVLVAIVAGKLLGPAIATKYNDAVNDMN